MILERIVQAVNTITTQAWAFVMLLVGVVSVILFHKNGIDIGIAAGIIGAAVNMFTSSVKSSTGSGSGNTVINNPLVQEKPE